MAKQEKGLSTGAAVGLGVLGGWLLAGLVTGIVALVRAGRGQRVATATISGAIESGDAEDAGPPSMQIGM